MTIWHSDLGKRKKTGGKGTFYRGKVRRERGSPPAETVAGEKHIRLRKTIGGTSKILIASAKELNVYIPEKRKFEKTEIVRVVSNVANRDYERRGVITKGAIVETPLGKARVTSRPGQHGVVNAILIGEQESR